MTIAEAHIPTDRAGRYLAQLCRHLSQLTGARHQPPAGHGDGRRPKVEQVEYSETSGTLRFDKGVCMLRATPDALELHLEADDEAALLQLQGGIAGRIEKIGRRDGLVVTWTRPPAAGEPHLGHHSVGASGARNHQHRSRGTTIGLAAVIVVLVAAHVGLLGAAVAKSAWAGWSLNVVLAIIGLKVALVAGHFALRHFGIRLERFLPTHKRRPVPTGQSQARE